MASPWHPVELEFSASEPHDDPFGVDDLEVTVSHPSGERFTVPGFWDGEETFKARFVPTKPGRWRWESAAADPALCETGDVVVEPGNSDRPLHVHGYLTPGNHTFRHADGTPFFWLADTAWTASTRATLEEWEHYLDYRDEQGYNAVQVNALRQHDGSVPHDRLPFGDEWDLDQPNLDYFQHLDELVSMCHERGIVPALVALWFDYAPGANLDWGVDADRRHHHTPEQARRLGRYLGARYGAYGATWLVSGDSEFNEECVEVYRAAAEGLGEACQYPLRTAHQPGGQSTPTIVNEEPWLDYHMYQSGHTHDLTVPERQAIECRMLEPTRPVLNGEPCYAEMNAYGTDELLDRDLVRAAAWISILSGGNVGITYGVLGIWPWHRAGDTFEGADVWGEPNSWDESLTAASGDDYARVKSIISSLAFQTLSPRSDLLESASTGEVAAVLADAVIVYLTDGRNIELQDAPAMTAGVWYDPATGAEESVEFERDGRMVDIPAPSYEGDAVFIGYRRD